MYYRYAPQVAGCDMLPVRALQVQEAYAANLNVLQRLVNLTAQQDALIEATKHYSDLHDEARVSKSKLTQHLSTLTATLQVNKAVTNLGHERMHTVQLPSAKHFAHYCLQAGPAAQICPCTIAHATQCIVSCYAALHCALLDLSRNTYVESGCAQHLASCLTSASFTPLHMAQAHTAASPVPINSEADSDTGSLIDGITLQPSDGKVLPSAGAGQLSDTS